MLDSMRFIGNMHFAMATASANQAEGTFWALLLVN